MKRGKTTRIVVGALAVLLAVPVVGMWALPGAHVSTAEEVGAVGARQAEEIVTRVQAEDAKLSLPMGTNMATQFVREAESASNGGAHIKTSAIGATVTLEFEGTGVRFFTKCGNGAGKLSVVVDGGDPQTIDEYINSSTATFQTQLFEATGLSETNEQHTIVLTTVAGEKGNFNFDYFEVISVDESSVDDTVQSPGNTTYYLDSSAPADGDGLSAEAAFDSLEDVNNVMFAPGDKIMIKAGSEFRGQLYPKGSGSADAPIVIDMYGEGEKPLIDGDGRYSDAPTFRDKGPFGEGGSAVYLCNQQYWEINNLRVTNWSDDGVDKERSGIRVEAYGGGTYHHIHIKNCEIFDIRGYNGQDSIWDVVPQGGGTTFYGARTTHRTGGINVVSYTERDLSQATSSSTAGAVLDATPTIFDDVLIEGNKIENCHSNGITTTNIRGELDDDSYRHTNVVIRNNEIKNVQRAGIVPLYTSGVLVERNLVDTFQQSYAGYGCGIWCDRANDMLFQYNEVCNGKNTMDGMAFNLDDMTRDGVIQYNYSHNNVGGGIMLHVRTNSYNRNNTVRYNLSVNDTAGYAAHQAILVCVGEDATTKIEDAKVYNNTFVNTNVVHPVYKGDEILFENNIFYLPNEGMASKTDAYDLGPNTSFKNNVFAGTHSPSEPQNTGANSGNVSVDESPLAGTFYGIESLEDAMEMAKLVHGSPALGMGDASIVTEAGVREDFHGNAAVLDGKLNAGIYNGESVDVVPDEGNPDLRPGEGSDDEPNEADYDVEYIEAEDERVKKSEGYNLVTGSQGHGGTHIYYSQTGTYVEYTFTGKAISIYTKTGPGAGTIDIFVDGEQVGVDDQYTAAQQFNKRAFTVVFDEEGEHTVRLENNGLKNPSATGNSFNFDCFKVFREKEVVKDSNANLASLAYALNDGAAVAIEGFSADVTSYEVELAEGTTGKVTLSGAAESDLASVEAAAAELVDGAATATLTVTAEDGTQKTYSVTFTVAEPEPEPEPELATVTFVTNGGSEVGSLTVDEDGHVAKPADPTRDGYEFGGWFTDEACTQAFDFETAVVTEDLTLFAKWTKVDEGGETPEGPDEKPGEGDEKPGDDQKPGEGDDQKPGDPGEGQDDVTPGEKPGEGGDNAGSTVTENPGSAGSEIPSTGDPAQAFAMVMAGVLGAGSISVAAMTRKRNAL